MTYKFRSEFLCNIEWTINPEEVEVYLSDDLIKRIPNIAAGLKELGLFKGVILNAVGYEFFAGDDYQDEERKMVPFEPEYRIDGADLVIFADGGFRVVFCLKHSGEEGFTDYFKPEQGVPL